MHSLGVEYSAVREAVLGVLGPETLRAGTSIEYGSREHCAMQVSRAWRIGEARGRLTELIGVRLDPMSVPPGVQMAGSSFFPAAEALASVGGPPEALMSGMTADNYPVMLWVMTETYGRNGTLALLRAGKELGGHESEFWERAIGLVQSTTRTADLLPPVLKRK
jgi:hypothetical protein